MNGKRIQNLSKIQLLDIIETSKTSDIPIEQIKAEKIRIEYKNRYFKMLKSTIGNLIIVAAISIIIAYTLIPIYSIKNDSMYPSLNAGDIVVAYKTDNISRGDVVSIFIGNKSIIRRCIAGPGDMVNINAKGEVFVNEVLIPEEYVDNLELGDYDIDMPCIVPNNKWFVLGDNRESALDSRNKSVGFVDEEQIIGIIKYKIWPFSAIGKV